FLPALMLAGALLSGCGDRAAEVGTEVEPPLDYDYGSTLARLPVDFTTQGQLWGHGHVTARVLGDQLIIQGEFADVESSVTGAHIHRARPGLRGPQIQPLEIVAEGEQRSGTVGGAIQLTDEVAAALEGNELYVQIYSEANPDGVLRGWLFPPRSTAPASPQ
ncbi:MAG: CHRD domain-containing protein, partial [Longimicrobiales bacterium]